MKYIYQQGNNANGYTLLLLHGTGGDETDLIPLAKQLGGDNNILSVRGNVLEHGMPRFFKRLGMGIFDEEDLRFRTEELRSFLQEAAVKEQFDLQKVIALGYSNGANIAGALMVLHPEMLAGAILFRPMQPFKDIAGFKATAPVFFSTGQQDPTIRPEDTGKYLQILRDGGFEVESHMLPTSHGLIQQDLDLATKWLHAQFP